MDHPRCSRGYLGIDLAWKGTNRTGLAVVDQQGALVASGAVRADDEISRWIADHVADPVVVAVDAPLVVPNLTGQRVAEREIGRAYGRYGAAAYPSNRGNPLFDPPRAETIARAHGWAVDPDATVGAGIPVCVEVYPHPALVGLFELPQRVLYKKGTDRRSGFLQLLDLLESIPELALVDHPRWQELVAIVADPRPGDLTRIEDEIDAILCAHLAWLWHHRRGALQVYGSLAEGYIVAPPPPTHASTLAKVPRSRAEPQSPDEIERIEV